MNAKKSCGVSGMTDGGIVVLGRLMHCYSIGTVTSLCLPAKRCGVSGMMHCYSIGTVTTLCLSNCRELVILLITAIYAIACICDGGGRFRPPPLRDFRDSSHIFGVSNTKCGIPYPASTWHRWMMMQIWLKIGWILFWENDVFVTLLHAIWGRNMINL